MKNVVKQILFTNQAGPNVYNDQFVNMDEGDEAMVVIKSSGVSTPVTLKVAFQDPFVDNGQVVVYETTITGNGYTCYTLSSPIPNIRAQILGTGNFWGAVYYSFAE